MRIKQGRSWYSAGWFSATVGVTSILGVVITALAYLFPSEPDGPPIPVPESSGTPIPGSSAPPSATGLANPPSLPARPAPTPALTSPAQVASTLFDGDVRLESKTGADIEGGQKDGHIKGNYSEGISGPIDLYLDFITLRVASDGLYDYQEPEREAYARCREIANSGPPRQPVYPYPIVNKQFCFITSDNHVAWMRVSGSNLNPASELYALLRVKVWE